MLDVVLGQVNMTCFQPMYAVHNHDTLVKALQSNMSHVFSLLHGLDNFFPFLMWVLGST